MSMNFNAIRDLNRIQRMVADALDEAKVNTVRFSKQLNEGQSDLYEDAVFTLRKAHRILRRLTDRFVEPDTPGYVDPNPDGDMDIR